MPGWWQHIMNYHLQGSVQALTCASLFLTFRSVGPLAIALKKKSPKMPFSYLWNYRKYPSRLKFFWWNIMNDAWKKNISVMFWPLTLISKHRKNYGWCPMPVLSIIGMHIFKDCALIRFIWASILDFRTIGLTCKLGLEVCSSMTCNVWSDLGMKKSHQSYAGFYTSK